MAKSHTKLERDQNFTNVSALICKLKSKRGPRIEVENVDPFNFIKRPEEDH